MKIRDVLQRDPATHPLVNHGQARLDDHATERGELATFVCEGQFSDGIRRILESYLACQSQTSQKAAWVSGFYGSGKSHLLKMLCHLWADTKFEGGATARSLVPALPDDLRNLFRELDTAGRRAGGLLAAAGSLPSGSTDHVRLTILGVLLAGAGLPAQLPQAQFSLWLHEQGWFERVKDEIEKTGKAWPTELNNLYVSGLIVRALLACDPNFAGSEAEARGVLKAQFPPRTSDITTAEFLGTAKRALALAGRDGRIPCTLLVLDEVQQYIGTSADRSTLVTEVIEALSKQFDSQVLVVGAGQSALTEVPLLHKLMDRFTIRVPLSDTDVETVTRKVLLQKNPSAVANVKKLLDDHAGEVSRHLQGTRIAETSRDRSLAADDYPLLPVRRRFWEHCFRQVDAAGTQSQLRSQLRIIHDAVAKLSSRPLGAIVPADELFDALAPEMVNTGVLLREINGRIIGLAKDDGAAGSLKRRICGLVFLVGRLPREGAADIGVRATKEHIADLLVDDLSADNGKLRSAVGDALEQLVSDGVLMRIGDEVRLQTREGAEWDREFRNRQTRLVNDPTELHMRRDQVLHAEVDRVVRSVKLVHGAAKVSRSFAVSRDATPPLPNAEAIPLWVRDEWSTSPKEVLDEARKAGSESAILIGLLPRQSAQELHDAIAEADAAQQTLEAKGTVTTDAGTDARRSMEGRRDAAVRRRDEIVRQVVANAKLYLGGGAELLQLTLEEKLREGANAALARLFPRFNEADALAAAWEAAIKRAREGADQPLQPVGHQGPTEQHPVCQQVLSIIGAGKTGTALRKALTASPFGWPQDAIDAAAIALHRSQHIAATLNGTPVAPGQLDQSKLAKAELRVEKVTLSVTDRLALRKLFQSAGVSCKPNEEAMQARAFIDAVLALATNAGGEPPLPPAPPTAELEDLRARVGTDLLAGILERRASLEAQIGEWTKAKELAAVRWPVWRSVERMAHHATGLQAAAKHVAEIEAVRAQRLLLAPTDPVAPLRSALADALRVAVTSAREAHGRAHRAALDTLAKSDVWGRLSSEQQGQMVASAGLAPPAPLDVSTDEALLAALDALPLAARQAAPDAVVGQQERALALAARELEPKVRPVAIERATLKTADDVKRWAARQEEKLLEAVQSGPVLVS